MPIFVLIFVGSESALASSAYMNSNQVSTALQNLYGAGAGVNTTSCALCHNSAAGGPGNINADFGADFQTAASAEGLSPGSGLSTGQLQTIFANATFLAADSDGDADDNNTEFNNNTNPNDSGDNSVTPQPTTGTGSADGFGCGSTSGPNAPPPWGSALLALPLLALFWLRSTGLRAQNL